MYNNTYFCSIIEKNRTLADFYIPRLSKDIKIVVQKNDFGGQILYRSLVPSKNGVLVIIWVQNRNFQNY